MKTPGSDVTALAMGSVTAAGGAGDAKLTVSPAALSASGTMILVRVSVPSLGVQKTLRASTADLGWNLKRQIIEKIGTEIKDVLNYGLYLCPAGGKLGKFLEEKRDLGSYQLDTTSLLEFIPKKRLNVTLSSDGEGAPTPKNQKKFLEDVSKGNIERVRERGAKGMDPNFYSETGETPLSIAVMNNDKDMTTTLIENGAFLDYRVSDKDTWKAPIHIAAGQNKPAVLQALIKFGAWVNCPDAIAMTPLYYAATGGHRDCVEKLLMAKAETEIFDESGKGPLHQACLNSHDKVVALLVDFGANMEAVNAAGNTPLHVSAARNSVECARWLLMRGSDREKVNKNGQTPQQAATLAASTDVLELIKNFSPDQMIPPPPKWEEYEKIQAAQKLSHSMSPTATKFDHIRTHSEQVKPQGESLGGGGHARASSDFVTSSNRLTRGATTRVRPKSVVDEMDEPQIPRSSSFSNMSIYNNAEGTPTASQTIGRPTIDRRSKLPGPPTTPRPASIPIKPISRPNSVNERTGNMLTVGDCDTIGRVSVISLEITPPPQPQAESPQVQAEQPTAASLVAKLKTLVGSGASSTELMAELDALATRLTA